MYKSPDDLRIIHTNIKRNMKEQMMKGCEDCEDGVGDAYLYQEQIFSKS